MSQVSPSQFDAFHVFVEEYNSVSKSLTLCLLLADFDLLNISDPVSDQVIEMLNQLYEQATIRLLEEYFGLAQISEGESFKDFETRQIIYIREDYLLEEIQPSGFIPASVVDYTQWEFLKYRKITLIYCALEDFPAYEDFDPCPSNQPHRNIVHPAYPSGLAWSSPYPDLTGALSWHTIWSGYAGYSPDTHWRYRILGSFYDLLAADPNSSDYWMKEEVYDCFRESRPSDGSPWYSDGDPVQYISRGINDSWYDSYVELRDERDYAPNAYQREQRWLANSGQYSYRLVQPGTEDHVQIQARLFSSPGRIYQKKPSPDISSVVPSMIPLLKGLGEKLGCLGGGVNWLWDSLLINNEQLQIDSEDVEIK